MSLKGIFIAAVFPSKKVDEEYLLVLLLIIKFPFITPSFP
jgi:hypothetical protein